MAERIEPLPQHRGKAFVVILRVEHRSRVASFGGSPAQVMDQGIDARGRHVPMSGQVESAIEEPVGIAARAHPCVRKCARGSWPAAATCGFWRR